MGILYIDYMKGIVNNSFQNKEPWQIVSITATTVLGTVWIWNFIFCQDKSKNKHIFNIQHKIILT